MGRPPKYESEAEREAARRATYKKARKGYLTSIASVRKRREFLLDTALGERLDAFCEARNKNPSEVAAAALDAYLKRFKSDS